jgi:PAS domain S-box-containing protein
MCAVRINRQEPAAMQVNQEGSSQTRHFSNLPMPPHSHAPMTPRQAVSATTLAPGEYVPRSRHRMALDSLYEAVLVTDLDGTIVEVNARAEQMTQVSQFDLVGQSISVIVPTVSEDVLHRTFEHFKTTNHATMEGWCQRADDSRLRVEIAVSRMDSPNRKELVFSLRNNTRQYTAKLQHLNERLMLQHVACGIALVDIDSCIQYVNTAFVQIWRHDDQESVIGKNIQEIWPADVAAQLVDPLTSSAPWSGEITVALPVGPTLSFQANSVPYQNRDGKTEGVVISFIDITALKTAEDKIRREAELQKDAARQEGNFAGSLNILSIPDLMQLVTSSSKTGTLEIMDARNQETAFASFDNGRIVCATCGAVTGEAAVESMIEQGGQLFRFRQDTIRYRDPSITRGTMGLLLDATRILDEKKETGKQ